MAFLGMRASFNSDHYWDFSEPRDQRLGLLY